VSIAIPFNIYPFTRRTSPTPFASFNSAIIRLRCFKSHTSRSIIISVKSGAVRTIDKFLQDHSEINKLYRTFLTIDSDSSCLMAERLKKFAADALGIMVSVETAAANVKVKPYAKLFAENKELWIWATSPLEVEHAGYWEKLCSEFLDHEGRMLVYFVPRLEVADQLALRFETELRSRLYDAEGNELKDAQGFGATIFIIVTNLAAMVPYVILANPGSANLRQEGIASSGWFMGDNAQYLYEMPDRFSDQLIQQTRAAGLGLASIPENFFPMGEPLKGAGVPYRNYRYLDYLIAIVHDNSVGLFDGKPVEEYTGDTLSKARSIDRASTMAGDEDESVEHPTVHPLKLYPVFIRAYRKKAGDLKTKLKPPTAKKTSFFHF